LTRHPGTEFLLFGDRALIDPELTNIRRSRCLRVVHTDVAVSMNDKPSQGYGAAARLLDVAVDRRRQEGRGRRGGVRRQHRRADGDGTVLLAHAARIERPAIAAIWPTARGESV
jgi:glycerol-3-phosphate acyltransferase PlsX